MRHAATVVVAASGVLRNLERREECSNAPSPHRSPRSFTHPLPPALPKSFWPPPCSRGCPRKPSPRTPSAPLERAPHSARSSWSPQSTPVDHSTSGCSRSKRSTSPRITSRTGRSNQQLPARRLAASTWTACWAVTQPLTISTRLSMCASILSSRARTRRCSGCGGGD